VDNSFATVCSLLPYQLTELKPGVQPGQYVIPKAESGLSLTIIPNNIYYQINPDPLADSKQVRLIKVPIPAMECARSIINDYVSSLLAVEPPDKVPGLFAVAGDWSDKKEFSLKHMKELVFYKNTQNNWFTALVNIADDFWSKTHSPASISDLQREACKILGFRRDWLNPVPFEQAEKCPFCQNAVITGAIKCVTCGEILDKKKYNELVGVK
jgi:hypothetical protein